MNWLATQMKHVGEFFTGKADWLEQQDKEIKEKFSAYNATVRKTIIVAFALGVAAGLLVK